MATLAARACDQCGLPLIECSGLSVARSELREFLREHGYTGLQARDTADRLIPEPKRK